ncbi:MAG TPA: hypothetical protein PKN80_00145 [bacterium]|nr:hypothetical protein [bacterium]HNS48127.1 hypothetical protein [bacterium]
MPLNKILHLTSGDCAGGLLARSGLEGEIFVWHDILYDGPRRPGWPDEAILAARARFIEAQTGRGLSREKILKSFRCQYARLRTEAGYGRIVLWFDACLFDQSMLVHILVCLLELNRTENVELLCLDAFPGIVPFHGLGQLTAAQLLSVYGRRRPVTEAQFLFAKRVDAAFALQDKQAFAELAAGVGAPLPWVPAAVARWLQEQPDGADGLGRLERLALEAVRNGKNRPREIFAAAAAGDTPPQFWGDTTLWAKINSLADKELVLIEGPSPRLPQWEAGLDLDRFQITPA